MASSKKTHQKSSHQKPREKRFHFETFTSRIDSISIESLRNVGGYTGSNTDGNSSWFELSLKEWQDLNCTTPFTTFCKQLEPFVGQLSLLLLYKQDISDLLIKHLTDDKSALAWKPISNLVAVLAKDLDEEFYPHFLPLFDALLNVLVTSQESDVIEAAFTSILFIFKTQTSSVLNDFTVVYSHFLSLTSKRTFLTRFATQIVSYLLKKADDPVILLNMMISSVDQDARFLPFVSNIICQTIHDEKSGKLRACTKSLIIASYTCPKLLNLLCPSLLLTVKYPNPLWKILIDRLADSTDILIRMVLLRKGSKLTAEPCELLLNTIPNCEPNEKTLALLAFVLKVSSLESILKYRNSLHSFIQNLNIQNLSLLALWFKELSVPHRDLLQFDNIVATAHIKTPLNASTLVVLLSLRTIPHIDVTPLLDTYDFSYNCVEDQSLCSLIIPALSIYIGDLSQSFTQLLSWPDTIKQQHLSLWLKLVELVSKHSTIDDYSQLLPFLSQPSILRIYPNIPVTNLLPLLFHPLAEIRILALERLPTSDLQELLLKLESIPTDLPNYRERLLLLRQLELFVMKSGSGFDLSIFCRFLFGQLHVKLSLLVSETFRLLSRLIEKNESILCPIFDEIFSNISSSSDAVQVPNGPDFDTTTWIDHEVEDESIRKFPSLFTSIQSICISGHQISLPQPTFGLQPSHWEVYLKYFAAHPPASLSTKLLNIFKSTQTNDTHPNYSTDFIQINQRNLTTWLTIISKCPSKDEDVRFIVYEFLSLGDGRIQSLALDAILTLDNTIKSLLECRINADPKSLTWYTRLKGLFDDHQIKDTLATMTFESNAIPLSNPTPFFDLLARLFYGQVVSRGKHSAGIGSGARRNPMHSRRKLIFSAMTCDCWWASGTFNCFINNILVTQLDLPKKQIGFLTVLESVFSFGMTKMAVAVIENIFYRIIQLTASNEKRVRQLGWQRILQFTSLALKHTIPIPHLEFLWTLLITPRIPNLDNELISATDSLILDFLTFCSKEVPSILSFEGSTLIWSKLVSAISHPSTKSKIIKKILDIIEVVYDKKIFPIDSSILQALISRLSLVSGSMQVRVISAIRQCASTTSFDDPQPAIDALFTLLTLSPGKCSEAVKADILNTLSVLCTTISDPLYLQIASLLRTLSLRAARQAAVNLLSIVDFEFSSIVASLESWIRVKLEDEPDYETRQRAMRELPSLSLEPRQWNVILNVLMYQMTLDDLALRSHATSAVQACINEPTSLPLVLNIVYPSIKSVLKSSKNSETIRSEHVNLLQQLILHFDTLPFTQMRPLLSLGHGEEEASLFYNIYHVQKHRRCRTIRRLAEVMETSHPSKAFLQDILIPILMPFAIPRSNQSLDGVLQQDALNTLGLLISLLPPNAFLARIHRLVTRIGGEKSIEKAVIKLIPIAINHFNVDGSLLEDRLLPILLGLWNSGKKNFDILISRIPIAVGIARLLSRSTIQLERHLPALLTSLAQVLRCRERDEVREACRKALEQITTLLGPTSLPSTIQILLSVVNDGGKDAYNSGYQRHVMLHVICSLIIQSPSLDWSTSKHALSTIIWDGSLGHLANEKTNTEWTGKLFEVRSQRSYEAIDKIASLIPLDSLPELITDLNSFSQSIFLDKVINTLFSAIVARKDIRDMFSTTVESIHNVTPFIDIIKCCLSFPWSTMLGLRLFSFGLKNRIIIEPTNNIIDHSRLLEHASLIKPLVSIVLSLFHNSNSGSKMTIQVLITMSSLMRWFVIAGKSLDINLTTMMDQSFALVVQNEFTVPCLRLIAALVRDTNTELSANQLKALIQLTRQALQEAQLGDSSTTITNMNQPALCFTLAHSLLTKKVMLVDIFDLMQTVSEGIVISPSTTTREHCRRLLLHFLKDYPMTDNKRLEYINMLLRNLRYEQLHGRLSVCEALGTLITIPTCKDLINVQAWCLAVIERMANEEDDGCIMAIGSLVRNLISKHGNDQVFDLVDKWNSSSNELIHISSLKLLKWIGLGFIDAGHAKLVFKRVSLFKDYNESVIKHLLDVYSSWIVLHDIFFKYNPDLKPFYTTHPQQVIHIMRLYAERQKPVDTDYLLENIINHPSEDMLQTLILSAKPEFLRKILGMAKRNEGEPVLSLACQYALHYLLSKPSLDTLQIQSLLSFINYCRTQSRCLQHIDTLDHNLQTYLGSTTYADASQQHSIRQRTKRMARHTLLANLAVTNPSAVADIRLRRNRRKAEQQKSKKRKGQSIGEKDSKRKRKKQSDEFADIF